jgi:hypothetical protein
MNKAEESVLVSVLKIGPDIEPVKYWFTGLLVEPLSHWLNRMTKPDDSTI